MPTSSHDNPWNVGRNDAEKRWSSPGQEPATVWLTGLPGSGKSTLASALSQRLRQCGSQYFVLDSDNIRRGLSCDLSFSQTDRRENIRRAAEVARLLNDAGLFTIAAFISPYREDRELAKQIIGGNRFIETHVSTRVDICEQRDPKGLYARARAGLIDGFTGVSAPYEAPEYPDVVIDAGKLSVAESVDIIMDALMPRFRV